MSGHPSRVGAWPRPSPLKWEGIIAAASFDGVDRATFIVVGLLRVIMIDHNVIDFNVIDHKGVVRIEHDEDAALRRRHPFGSHPTTR